MYLEMATEDDKKMVEIWKADADGILIFVCLCLLLCYFTPTQSPQTGLFSAAVASLISVSIQNIQKDPQDTSNFYLANIYRTLADPNRSNISSSLPASPPPFSPPTYAVWVNALWFMSLVISLTCALLATLLQQWARRYLMITQSRYAPHKRARIRAFLSEGVEKLLLPWIVEALPMLLHLSLFLFFTGLVVFLWNVDLTIFKLVLSWVSICAALYGCITVVPIFRPDSQYHTPLSLPAWHIVTGISFLTFRVLGWFAEFSCVSFSAYYRFRNLKKRFHKRLVQGMQRAVEEAAFNSPSEIDTRAFLWTFDSLDEDHELERFFSGLPGFRRSIVVKDPLLDLADEGKQRVFAALTGLLDRTFSSDLLPELVKRRRAIICMKAVDPAHTTEAFSVLNKILFKYQDNVPLVSDIVQIVRGWGISWDEDVMLEAQANISRIVARAQPRNDSWSILASDHLGVPQAVLQGYAAHGDSLSLAILIHITRQQLNHFRKSSWPWFMFSEVLLAASKFDARDTLPELQHDFCALWNQIVRRVQNVNSGWMAFGTLGRIRNVYLALHQGAGSTHAQFSASTGDSHRILAWPFSYPACNIPGHHPDSTHHICDDFTPTTSVCTASHDHDLTAHVPSLHVGNPEMPSSSEHTQILLDEIFADALARSNNISVPVSL